MKVVKSYNEFGYKKIILIDANKELLFTYGGNGDLYWILKNKDSDYREQRHDFFVITKENYQVYSIFEELFNNIHNFNIYDDDEIPFYLQDADEIRDYLRKRKQERKWEIEKYIRFNASCYNDLYDRDSKVICWHSDETNYLVSNVVKIKKLKDMFLIRFYTQKQLDGYDREYDCSFSTSIRFRNSGSRYDPFNLVFMQMFQKLQDVDDVLDKNHQLHIEEYVYEKPKILKK